MSNPPDVEPRESCEWIHQPIEEAHYWKGGCGFGWVTPYPFFTKPFDAGMRFCPRCGGRIKISEKETFQVDAGPVGLITLPKEPK